MSSPQFKRRLLAVSISSAVALTSSALFAQDEILEIAVTGSRIRMTDGMATPVPVTALTTDELSNFDPGGTISEQLDALPQFFNTQTSQRGGQAMVGTGGAAQLNMRNLGAQRTLVLMDGGRMPPADKRGPVNIDMLPTGLMRTVDVVTGGASAAYGADALGGVVNFVLDREFEGLDVTVGTGVNEWGDGQRWNVSVAGGRQFGDRLNVIGSFQSMEIRQIDRDPEDLDSGWWQRWGHVTCPQYAIDRTGPQRCTYPNVTSTEDSPTGMIWARNGTSSASSLVKNFPLSGYVFTEDGRDVRPYIKGDVYSAPNARGTKSMSGGPEATLANRAYPGAPSGNHVLNRSGFLGVTYDLNENVTVFADALVGRSESNRKEIRGGQELSQGWHMNIYRDNAFLPEVVGQAMDAAGIDSFQLHKNGGLMENFGRDPQERDDRGVFTTWMGKVGFEATLPNDWDLRATWQTAESRRNTAFINGLRVDRVGLAMDAVRDPATGAIVCNVQLYNPTVEQLRESVGPNGANRVTSPGGTPGGTTQGVTLTEQLGSPVGLDNSIRDCVPWNPFGMGHTDQNVIDYLGTDKVHDSYVDQDFAEAIMTGELYEGWGYGPVSFATGLTWREQSFRAEALPTEIDVLGPVVNVPSLGIRGNGPLWAGGSANLHQFSTVPKISGGYDVWEWFGELNAPIWESDSGNQQVGGSLAYRSSDYSNVGRVESWKAGLDIQVMEGLRFRLTRSHDVREATFAERFDAQAGGVDVADPERNNAVAAVTFVRGGNPNLAPEEANTNVAGIVYQPTWLEGLSLSADWYDVQINGSIGALGEQRIVDECFAGNQSLCAQILRTPDGSIGRIFNVALNVAQARVRGIDYEATYSMEPNFFDNELETFNVRVLAGFIQERSDTPLGGRPTNTIGDFTAPDLTAVATMSYGVGPYSIQFQQRYITDTMLNWRWTEGVHVDNNSVSSGNYTNMRLGYSGETNGGANWRLDLSVNNLFDRPPPIVPSYSTRNDSQTVPNGYDEWGRRYQLSLNYNF